MTFTQELECFRQKYVYRDVQAAGGMFHYMLAGQGRPLIFLNGGMNCSEMWLRYVEPLSRQYQVLLLDYPREFTTNGELGRGLHGFFAFLGLKDPMLVGASDGGMVAQFYARDYPGEVAGLALITTGGVDAGTLRVLRRRFCFAQLRLWHLRRCDYEKVKPKIIRYGSDRARNESPQDYQYVREMFAALMADYTREKDVHASGLLADILRQKPATREDFASLSGRVLLMLPDDDFFSHGLQENLVALMPQPRVLRYRGGHVSAVLQAQRFVGEIREMAAQILGEPSSAEKVNTIIT